MSKLSNKLFDYQLNTFNHIKDTEGGVLLSLDLGLGKTMVATVLLEHWINQNHLENAIVVCQSIKLNDWKEELLQTEIPTDWKIVVLKTNEDLNLIKENKTIYILSYAIFSNLPNHQNFQNINIKTGFLYDECQTMKDWKTKISQAGLKTAKKTTWKVMISGDPISNSYKDLFVLFKILGFYFDDWDCLEMEKLYFDNHFMYWKEIKISPKRSILKPIANKNEDELIKMLHSKGVFIKTNEVMTLPKQFFEKVCFDLPSQCNLILLEMKNRFLKRQSLNHQLFEPPNNYDVVFEPIFLTDLFKHNYTLSSGFLKHEDDINIIHNTKISLLGDIINKHNPNNIVVFYNFNQELKMIKEQFNLTHTIVEINGNSHLERALPMIKPTNTLILVQYKAGATGINLQAYANIIVYYTLTTSGELYKQSLKRIHRIGQTKDCFYYHLIAKRSVDEKIYETITNSQKLTDAIFLNWLKNSLK